MTQIASYQLQYPFSDDLVRILSLKYLRHLRNGYILIIHDILKNRITDKVIFYLMGRLFNSENTDNE